MPIIFGTALTSATYDKATLLITCVGEAFGENLDPGPVPINDIQVSVAGAGIWVSVSTILSWSDTLATGTLPTSLLPSTTYDAKIISSDGEEADLSNAFTVTANFPVIDVGSSWKTVSNIYVNSGSTSWKTVMDMKIIVSGAWKSHV
jgi:hypothetical protein